MNRNNYPLVSVIIPVFNGSKYINETLNSILVQNYSNIEIIIIDDGSTDNIRDIIEQINNSKIHYFYQENSGVSKSRNEGLKKSCGDFIIFFDSDDLMTEGFVYRRMDFLTKNPELDFCGGDVLRYYDENNISYNQIKKSITKDIFVSILSFDPLLVSCPSSYMFKKDSLFKHEIQFNDKLSNSADKYFLLESVKLLNYGYVPNTPLYYRVHSQSMSGRVKKTNISDGKVFLKLVTSNFNIPSFLKRKFLSKKYYNIAAESFHISGLDKFKSPFYLFISFLQSPKTLITLVFNK